MVDRTQLTALAWYATWNEHIQHNTIQHDSDWQSTLYTDSRQDYKVCTEQTTDCEQAGEEEENKGQAGEVGRGHVTCPLYIWEWHLWYHFRHFSKVINITLTKGTLSTPSWGQILAEQRRRQTEQGHSASSPYPTTQTMLNSNNAFGYGYVEFLYKWMNGRMHAWMNGCMIIIRAYKWI